MIKRFNQFLNENNSGEEDIKEVIRQYFYEVTDNFDSFIKIINRISKI